MNNSKVNYYFFAISGSLTESRCTGLISRKLQGYREFVKLSCKFKHRYELTQMSLILVCPKPLCDLVQLLLCPNEVV